MYFKMKNKMKKQKCIHCSEGIAIDGGNMCEECKEEDSSDKERTYIG